jgi:hypothetical protein
LNGSQAFRRFAGIVNVSAGGGIFIVLNALSLLRKLFSVQTKPSNLKENLVKGKMTKRPQVIEGVVGRCNAKASAYVAMIKHCIIVF